MRNAAGKAFQGWKAALAAAAALNREIVAERFRGRVRTRDGRLVGRADWVIAVMPTGLMRTVAQALETVYGFEVVALTDVALNLHEYQYNGPDPTGVLSRYTDPAFAKADIRRLAIEDRRFAEKLRGQLSHE